jgi:hypothetical protein
VDDIASEIGMSREIAFAIARTNGPASEKLELT